MQKKIMKKVTFCDHCQKEAYVDKCLRCGVEHCWECKRTEGIEHGLGFTGSVKHAQIKKGPLP